MFVSSKAFRIMLGDSWFDLVGKQKLLCTVKQFYKITEVRKASEFFTGDLYTNFLHYPKFAQFLELHKYSKFSYCYLLFCFCQILFSLRCVLILMNLWTLSGGISHRKVGIQGRDNAKIKYEWVCNSTYSSDCFLILTDLTKVLLSFVWLKSSSVGWSYDGWRNKD